MSTQEKNKLAFLISNHLKKSYFQIKMSEIAVLFTKKSAIACLKFSAIAVSFLKNPAIAGLMQIDA